MKIQVALLAAAGALFAAAPASADEYRLEARGGIAWSGGVEEEIAGMALGYDFDLGEVAFVGVEASLDKVLAHGAEPVFGGVVRAGARVGRGKVYAAGSYNIEEGEDSWSLGGGYQHRVGSRAYLKAEYRHFFYDTFQDANAVVVGIGLVG